MLNVANNQVLDILEKPERRDCVSAGIYLLRGKALRHLPDDKPFTMPELINSYLARGEKVGGFKVESFWIGIENAENLDTVLKRIESLKP